MVGGRCQAGVARPQPVAGPQHRVAVGKILAAAAYVLAGGGRMIHAHRVALGRRVFLQQHRVGARRDDAAGEQAHRLAPFQSAVERPAGWGGAHHAQPRALRRVGRAQGVPVHGGHIGRRLRQARGHVGSQHTAPSFGQSHRLVPDRLHTRQNAAAGFLDRQHDQSVPLT